MATERVITGTSPPIKILKKTKYSSPSPLESYFLVRIHSAQAVYRGTIWNRVKRLVVTSRIALGNGQESMRAIQRTCPIQRNQAQQLGLATNLIDLIPATLDKVSISLEYRLDSENRFETISKLINSDAFVSVLSLAPGAIAAAKTITGITNKVISTFLEGENEKPILEFSCDLNILAGDVASAYYVILGTHDENYPLPSAPNLQVQGSDLLLNGKSITDLSYIVLDVTTIPARTKDLGRGESWYKKLIEAEQASLKIKLFDGEDKRRAIYDQCFDFINEASILLLNDPLYHPNEARAIIQSAYDEISNKIFPKGATKGLGAPQRINSKVKSLLGVENESELTNAVSTYSNISTQAKQALTELGLV